MKYVTLPLVMLLAVSGCSGSNERVEIKDGTAPKGGEKIIDQAVADQQLGALVNKFASALKENDDIEVFALADGIDTTFSSTRFNSRFTISDFGIQGALDHLFDGNNKNLQGALGFTGADVSYKVDATPEDTSVPETHWDKSVKFGKLSTYFNDGNIYIDASEAKPFETIQGLARAIEPFYTIFANRYETLKVASPVINLLNQADTSKVEEAFDDFGGKIVIKGADLSGATSFASLIQSASNDDVNIAAQNFKYLLKKGLGIVWDDVASMYTYPDGEKGIEFKLDSNDLLSFIQPEDVEYYGISIDDSSFISFAIYFDEEGFPVALSYETKVDAVSNAEFMTNIVGSPLTFTYKSGFELYLDHNDAGDFVMPNDLGDYKTISSLILKLTSLIIK